MRNEKGFYMKRNKINNLVLSAMFLAVAYVLPFVAGQIPEIGNMLCPMHIPVILCGFICGGPWGLLVGFIAPLFRSLTIGMPTLFPKAVAMAFELATYGLISGLMYRILPKKKGYIYAALVIAMISGRLVWGLVQFACAGLSFEKFGFAAFWAGAVANAIPGIIIQIILVPVLVMLAEKLKNKSEI